MASGIVQAQWQNFLDEPARYAKADRLSQCFGAEISPSGCEFLLRSGRLRSRLSRRLIEHYQLPEPIDGALPDQDQRIALLAADELHDLALRSGAIFWSGSIAGIIEKERAAALQSQLGNEITTFSLRHRDLSARVQPLPPIDRLPSQVSTDGWLCFLGWLTVVPDAVSARVRLKFSNDALGGLVPAHEHLRLGPEIVRRAIDGLADG